LSSDDEVGVQVAKKIGQDVWVEVFLEAEEKWITVDVIRQKVHCVQLLQVSIFVIPNKESGWMDLPLV